MSFDIDIDYVKQVAREAGQRALGLVSTIRPEFKEDSSYVTQVDRETELYVQARLAERYPDYAFLGEEYGRRGSETAPLWAVDPIDGTTNLVFGIPLWCVSIGLIVGGRPVAGALYLPRTDELFYGVEGRGSYCNGERLAPRDREQFHPEDTLGFTSGALKSLDTAPLTGRLRCLGSIATDIAYTARGTLACIVGQREGAYDMAAALCLATEAGCVAAYLSGDPLDLGRVVVEGKTTGPFAVAPPRTFELLQKTVHRRKDV